jgi:hypothetical protein
MTWENMLEEGTGKTAKEIARLGEKIYKRDVRASLETEQNRGKFLIIGIATGADEIDQEDLAAIEWLLARHPNSGPEAHPSLQR